MREERRKEIRERVGMYRREKGFSVLPKEY